MARLTSSSRRSSCRTVCMSREAGSVLRIASESCSSRRTTWSLSRRPACVPAARPVSAGPVSAGPGVPAEVRVKTGNLRRTIRIVAARPSMTTDHDESRSDTSHRPIAAVSEPARATAVTAEMAVPARPGKRWRRAEWATAKNRISSRPNSMRLWYCLNRSAMWLVSMGSGWFKSFTSLSRGREGRN